MRTWVARARQMFTAGVRFSSSRLSTVSWHQFGPQIPTQTSFCGPIAKFSLIARRPRQHSSPKNDYCSKDTHPHRQNDEPLGNAMPPPISGHRYSSKVGPVFLSLNSIAHKVKSTRQLVLEFSGVVSIFAAAEAGMVAVTRLR